MKTPFLLLFFIVFWGCVSQKPTIITEPTVFDNAYYEKLETNIARIHQLMQGTFVAYSEGQDAQLQSWKVTKGDSVVLYAIAIGDIAKDGYWIYSYEFMTSLPNNPVYTSIKQIEQIDKDSFQVTYYKPELKLNLIDILEREHLIKNMDFKNLQLTDKKTVYTGKTASHFLGKSVVYKDESCKCLRQNTYDITPQYYKVETIFYNKKDRQKLDKHNRPNLMVRRDISRTTLLKIAEKEYVVEDN